MKPFEQTVNSKYGAPMGRRSDPPGQFAGIKIKLYRVHLYDYCYDKGGAYWGSGDPLYCAVGENSEQQLAHYFRCKSYQEAKQYMKNLS